MLRYVYNVVVCLCHRTNGLRVQNDYAQLLAKRVNEEKAKKTELRSMTQSPVFVVPDR